jgi:hypothetical protein
MFADFERFLAQRSRRSRFLRKIGKALISQKMTQARFSWKRLTGARSKLPWDWCSIEGGAGASTRALHWRNTSNVEKLGVAPAAIVSDNRPCARIAAGQYSTMIPPPAKSLIWGSLPMKDRHGATLKTLAVRQGGRHMTGNSCAVAIASSWPACARAHIPSSSPVGVGTFSGESLTPAARATVSSSAAKSFSR